jgi:hypothetical protein
MAFDPNSLDPSKIRELIVKGLVIDKRARTVKADHVETNPDLVIAARELAALSSMADPDEEVSPEVLAYRANLRVQLEANIPIPKAWDQSTTSRRPILPYWPRPYCRCWSLAWIFRSSGMSVVGGTIGYTIT